MENDTIEVATSSTPLRKRPNPEARAEKACAECRRSKVRCDVDKHNPCGPCFRMRKECSVVETRAPRKRKSRYATEPSTNSNHRLQRHSGLALSDASNSLEPSVDENVPSSSTPLSTNSNQRVQGHSEPNLPEAAARPGWSVEGSIPSGVPVRGDDAAHAGPPPAAMENEKADADGSRIGLDVSA